MSTSDSIGLLRRARDKFNYDPESGLLTHRTSHFKSKIGKVAGGRDNNGYVHVKIKDDSYPAHRIAWLLTYGELPSRFLDHINGDRADNRIANLRLATQSENNQNQRKARSDNKSTGILGVHYFPEGDKYRPRIMVDGKSVYLGLFETEKEARAAYLTAKRLLHPFGTI
jgi:hypothetical protein